MRRARAHTAEQRGSSAILAERRRGQSEDLFGNTTANPRLGIQRCAHGEARSPKARKGQYIKQHILQGNIQATTAINPPPRHRSPLQLDLEYNRGWYSYCMSSKERN